jgi:hypothetical protein
MRAITAPSPFPWLFHHYRSCRIQIDIATHFQKVGVFIHQSSLEAAHAAETGNKTIIGKSYDRKPWAQVPTLPG